EAADWVKKSETSNELEDRMEEAISIQTQTYTLTAHFVPLDFKPEDPDHIGEIETCNSLPSGSVRAAQWVNGKKDGKQKPNQRFAFLYLYMDNADTANDILLRETINISGKRCPVTRKAPAPIFCYHCQEKGHMSDRCPLKNENPICGQCGGPHRMNQCDNEEKVYCARCKTTDHARRDRSCPEYMRETKTMTSRQTIDNLTFFPTSNSINW
ncbi:hypothetical protein K435DRAFT_620793, partial [Dendrothele bispora CBS 962.96]